MAGVMIFPHSTVPVTAGKVFGNQHVGAGANSKHDDGLGWMASLDGDAIWRLRFAVPATLPTGTATLKAFALANATSGVVKLNPKWVSVAVEEDPSSATLIAEGTQTITWAAGDSDQYKAFSVTLDADTIVAGEFIVMDLVGEVTSWSLAVVMTLTGLRVEWV